MQDGARHSGVFLPGAGGHALWVGASWESCRATWEELAGQGFRLVDVEQVNPASGALLDGAGRRGRDGRRRLRRAEPNGLARAASEESGAGGAELPSVVMPRAAADDQGGAGALVTSGSDGSRDGMMVRDKS